MQLALVAVVMSVFLYTIRDLLNPFLMFLVLFAVMTPFRGRPGHALLTIVAALLTLLWVIQTTGFLLAPFVLALVLSYILDPLVDRLEVRGVNRSAAIAVLALPVLAAVIFGVVFGVPALARQIGELIQLAPLLPQRIADWLEVLDRRAASWELPEAGQQLIDRLRAIDAQSVIAFLEERRASILERTWQGVLGFGRGLGSVLGYLVVTPVLVFYLLRDWDSFTDSLAKLVPHHRRERVMDFVREYDQLLARYLRGQLTVALLIGFITAIGLVITRFPYALLIGVIVAVFSVVPYLGVVLSIIPAVLVALLSGEVLLSLLKVAVVFAVAQGLEATVVSPRIVGGSVGLHPVWVLLALAMGGFYFGIVGLLLAVPTAVGVKLLVIRGLRQYRQSELYRQGRDVMQGGEGIASAHVSGPLRDTGTSP